MSDAPTPDTPTVQTARQRVMTFRSVERHKLQDNGEWEVTEQGTSVDEQCNTWCDENNMNPIEANTCPFESKTSDEHIILFIMTVIVVDCDEQMRQEMFFRTNQQSLPAERVPANAPSPLPPEVRPSYEDVPGAPRHDLGDAIAATSKEA